MFTRVVCGFDGSPGSLAALRQGIRLLEPGGRFTAVTARYLPTAVLLGMNGSAAHLAAEAVAARDLAERELDVVPCAEARLVEAEPAECLLAVANGEGADLVVVGTGGHGRALGYLRRDVDTTILHAAPCSVLVARPADGAFPRRIAVGLDGSRASLQAGLVARRLARELGAELDVVAAADGGRVDVARLRRVHPEVRVDHRSAVDALEAASEDADLLVVGSRNLRGLALLGSVSERIAHRAACSVLVARPAQARAGELVPRAAVAVPAHG